MPDKIWLDNIKAFLSLEENKILSICLYGESRGESWPGIIACMNVIRNRVSKYSSFSDPAITPYGNYMAVIMKKYQFSCFLSADPNRLKLEHIATDFNSYRDTDTILGKIYFMCTIKEHIMDNTSGATHYFTDGITPPSWSQQMTQTIKIGHHMFFK